MGHSESTPESSASSSMGTVMTSSAVQTITEGSSPSPVGEIAVCPPGPGMALIAELENSRSAETGISPPTETGVSPPAETGEPDGGFTAF